MIKKAVFVAVALAILVTTGFPMILVPAETFTGFVGIFEAPEPKEA